MSTFGLTLCAIGSVFIIPQAIYTLKDKNKFIAAIIAHLVSFGLCIAFLVSAKAVAKASSSTSGDDDGIGPIVGQITWLIIALLVASFASFGVTWWALDDKNENYALIKAFLLTIASLAVFLSALGIVTKINV